VPEVIEPAPASAIGLDFPEVHGPPSAFEAGDDFMNMGVTGLSFDRLLKAEVQQP
jgi:hypothetical protein